MSVMISAIGVSYLLQNLVYYITGGLNQNYPTIPWVSDTVKILDDPMFAVLPRSHPRAKDRVFPISAFRGEPFLVYLASTKTDVDLARAMELAEIGTKAKYSSNFDMTILAMVEHNLGVTIMPRLILAGSSADVATVPLDPPVSRTLGMAVRSMADASPAMRRFMQCTYECLQDEME